MSETKTKLENEASEKLKTERYLVAYLDMLGSSEKIKRDGDNTALNQIDLIYRDVLELPSQEALQYFQSFKIKIFSDNIIVAVKLSTGTNSYESKHLEITRLFQFVSYFQFIALHHYSWFVRGCITVGPLCINERLVWGKALLEAYNIEAEQVIYPRVLITNKVMNLLSAPHTYYSESGLSNTYQDYDGFTILHFLKLFLKKGDDAHCLPVQNHLKEELHKHKKNRKILQKIRWTVNYYNLTCYELGLHELMISVESELSGTKEYEINEG